MNGKNLQELIKNLQVFYKCPSCSAKYRQQDITFLGKVDEHCFMQLTCDSCSLPILATVLLSSDLTAATTVPQVPKIMPFEPNLPKSKRANQTDLRPGERKRISSKEHIRSTEIAELHLYLSSHSTDLHTRFK